MHELYEEWLKTTEDDEEGSYLLWLEEQVRKLRKYDDPHGHIVSVRSDDLVPFIDEVDLEYVTELMLEDIAETIWNSDDDGWAAMFNQYLEATMADNVAHWQAAIDAEKKRRQAL